MAEIETNVETAPVAKATTPGGFTWGTGRRKTSVARVRIRPGSGKITVNGRDVDEYFPVEEDRNAVRLPLAVTNTAGQWDIFANTQGGGMTGQSGAVLLGLARALLKASPELIEPLRDHGLLTRDSRMKERKKYGQKGARKRFQFSKR